MPAIVALVASNFASKDRPRAYGLVASAGAIAVAAGPLIGGFVTTYWTWRYVFAGEVVLVIGILALTRKLADAEPEARFRLDFVGSVLSALGLGLAVFGVLRSGEWGWVLHASRRSVLAGPVTDDLAGPGRHGRAAAVLRVGEPDGRRPVASRSCAPRCCATPGWPAA